MNTPHSISAAEVGSVTLTKDAHLSKAYIPMNVTVDGMSMLVNKPQYSKAKPPMDVTPDGILTFSKEVQ